MVSDKCYHCSYMHMQSKSKSDKSLYHDTDCTQYCKSKISHKVRWKVMLFNNVANEISM
jgi:hypothetical protein